MINYALLYGKTAFTLAKDIGVTPQAAQEFIDAYFAGFPARPRVHRSHARGGARVGRGEDAVRAPAAGAGAEQPERQIRSAAERAAVNMPIQGTAADIMKRAMIDVHAALAAMPGARMILTVHDELLFEVPEARADEVARAGARDMQAAVALNVPLTVDVGIGGRTGRKRSR